MIYPALELALSAWSAAHKEEMAARQVEFQCVEALREVLPIKIGDVIEDSAGKPFKINAIAYSKYESLFAFDKAEPFWWVTGMRVRSDGTVSSSRRAVRYYNMDGTPINKRTV